LKNGGTYFPVRKAFNRAEGKRSRMDDNVELKRG
jgi:hypothetical protein